MASGGRRRSVARNKVRICWYGNFLQDNFADCTEPGDVPSELKGRELEGRKHSRGTTELSVVRSYKPCSSALNSLKFCLKCDPFVSILARVDASRR